MGLLLRMMKSYFSTGRYLILDSCFCVLKGLIQLSKKGFFFCAIINNRRYWPAMVPDKDMEDHFWGVEVEETDSIQGTVDDVIYNIWRLKDSNYVMSVMATDGCRLVYETCKDNLISWK